MKLRIQPAIPLVFLLACACSAATTSVATSKTASKTPLQGGIAEFKLSSFDGSTLKGRLLLGATVDALVIDGRLVEWMIVEPKKIRSCDTHVALEYYQMDILIGPLTPDQIITIQPGYWYGVDMDFLLFGSQIKEPKPNCFEGELVVKALDRRIAATLPLRVSRTDRPAAPAETKSAPEPPKPDSPSPSAP